MLDRRTLLVTGGAAMLAPILGGTSATASSAAGIPLWRSPPGGGGPSGAELIGATGAVTNIVMPTIEMVAPSRPNGAAVLVAAGGGYKRIEMASEARPAASWLAAHGITAFILRYRLPGEGWNAGPLAPLQDAQRALRMIQANADTWRIDPSRLGVLGFSSGGHLMGLAATRSGFASYPPADAIDAFSGRPQDAALIYPIITLQPPYDHTSSRRVLIGSRPSAAESAEWSVETHVRAKCPPIFLVQAVDDPISNPQNTIIMADACRAANIPVELHRLASGGHGFGMGSPNTPTGAWPSWYSGWLRTQGMLV